jgi:hypothetical protein
MKSDFKLEEGGEERLWEYIDGISSPEDRAAIEKLLATDPAWQAKHQELLDIQQLMQSSEMEEPSMRFTKNVMDEIVRLQIAPAAKTYMNKNIIRGITICFLLLIAGFLIYGFGQVEWQTSKDSYMPDLSKIDTSKFFNNTYMNIFMMINVVLGLFLLDRYLSNKREKYKKG